IEPEPGQKLKLEPIKLAPFESLIVRIFVEVEEPEGTEAGLPNEATVQGGGAPAPVHETDELTVSGAPTPFGINRFELVPEEEGGGVARQAGSHPFQITNSLDLNLTQEEWPGLGLVPSLPALPRDLTFHLPPGVIGNPTAVPTCHEGD